MLKYRTRAELKFMGVLAEDRMMIDKGDRLAILQQYRSIIISRAACSFLNGYGIADNSQNKLTTT